MRIALAGISHETNTYCQGLTLEKDFYVYRGAKILTTAGQESDMGGAVDACSRLGCEPVPIIFAGAQPSGIISREVYWGFKDEILSSLQNAGPLDGCVLLMHGAGVVEGIEDLEGDLAASVRALLGDVPIAASFDLHGNVTQNMADQLNAMFACHHYPHIDLHLRAAEAVSAVFDMATHGTRGICKVLPLPMLSPTTTTFGGIGESILDQLLSLEESGDCIDISWFHGFPYTDIEHIGTYVSVSYYPQDEEPALQAASNFAQTLWARKEELQVISLNGDEAVAKAVEFVKSQSDSDQPTPVVINETSDNCGGGAPGDGTHLLRSMLNAHLGERACFAFLVDAQVAQAAARSGVGSQIEIELGGKTDELHGAPLQLSAYVKALHDGRLTMQAMFKGAPLHLGPMARLVVDGLDIVVASRRSQTFDQEPFLALGIDIMKYDIVALKSSNHFRAGFQHLVSHIVTADTPGLTTQKIEVFARQKTARRLWPLDPLASYPE